MIRQPMNRQSVTSSVIRSIGHDPESNTLEIEMNSGKVYRHAGFSGDDHAELMAAESIGKHYNAFVKGKYEHTLVEQEANDGARE